MLKDKKNEVWNIVEIARNKERPNVRFYIENIFDDFIEFHGDRNFRDDKAVIGGIASIDKISVTVIGVNKGKNLKENVDTNFGMVHPEGYRKALRLMKQAEKFNRPIICFVDTPGAYCGVGAEERGQGQAIAQNLMEMSRLKTPIISIITGEGGSGGALGLSVSDKVYMLKNSIYSILSPEGFATILWKDSSRTKEAAGVMKITALDLLSLGIIDNIIDEPIEGAHTNPSLVSDNIKRLINSDLNNLIDIKKQDLLQKEIINLDKWVTFMKYNIN